MSIPGAGPLPAAPGARATRPDASETKRAEASPAAAVRSQRERRSGSGVLIKLDEIAKGNGKPDLGFGGKRVEIESIVK